MGSGGARTQCSSSCPGAGLAVVIRYDNRSLGGGVGSIGDFCFLGLPLGVRTLLLIASFRGWLRWLGVVARSRACPS
eukprot:5561528-Amphidinium_carterae.1